jgi:multidrug efflux system outer membrane protein
MDRRVALTEESIRNREEAVRIQRRRLAAGTGSRLEVRQAEGDLAEVAALLPRLQKAQATAERGLLVLAGGSPRDLAGHAIARAALLPEPPAIPAGLPSDLLARRPDVREAEAALVAANARVSEAKARYFPTIRLTASVGQESEELANLFTSPATVWNLAAGLTQPLFGLRKIDAEVDAATARAAAAEASYVRAAQAAFAEIYDALDARSASAQTLGAQVRRIAALRDAEHIAFVRHEAGAGAFLDLLDARRNLLQVEMNHIEVAVERIEATIDVYRALGGGWQETEAEPK